MKPVVILIRDGWGYRKDKKLNAIAQGNAKHTKQLMKRYPNIRIHASGEAVGLPKGFQGNSEVGHLTIGSGRIPVQPMVRIDRSINSGRFFRNKAFLSAIKNCKKHGSRLHLMGLLQTEGVHSKKNHLYALLKLCKKKSVKPLLHIFTDGRDAPPKIASKKISELTKKWKGFAEIASISGRYYAMDRDKRWNRTKKAYQAIVLGKAKKIVKLPALYKAGETDEFLIPRIKPGYSGVKRNDSMIFFNFRTDRTRQLTQAIVEKKFKGFKRTMLKVFFVAMTDYYKPMNAQVAFKHEKFKNILGAVLSKHKIKQLRISETEKYAHVTFFFNAENEKPFKLEDRILIKSPRVPTYDLKPEMSAYKITNRVLKEMAKYDVVVMNIVNGDMVGHTGDFKACKTAVKVVDECVFKIVNKVLELDGTLLCFADHGNVEDQTPLWRTSHTNNPVPFMVVSNNKLRLRKSGGLSDIAPTVLKLLRIKKPREMTGRSLIV